MYAKDYIDLLRACIDVRHPNSESFDKVFRYAVVQAVQGMHLHGPVSMPKDRTAMIEKANAADDGCISAGVSEKTPEVLELEQRLLVTHECCVRLLKMYERASFEFGYQAEDGTWEGDVWASNEIEDIKERLPLYEKDK